MTLSNIADASIAPALHTSSLKVVEGTTGDIMRVVLDCYKTKNNQVKNFAPHLKGSTVRQTCHNIWDFVKENIRYKVDPEGQQWIKEPARVWVDKVCDCKSYSVFIASCLRHLGINGMFRFVSFDANNSTPTHVYIVVPNAGKEIVIDCVLKKFNQEEPYQYKHDYCMTRISQLAGVPVKKAVVKKKAYATIATIGCGCDNNRVGVVPLALAATAKASLVKEGIQAGTDAAKGLIQSVFSANGVSPSFFNTFGFLKFLDNSTSQWKSRLAQFRNWSPEQRIAWYIDRMNSGDNCHSAMVQYAELFGNVFNGKGIDDRGRVPFALANLFNEVAEQVYFKGSDRVQCGAFTYYKKDMLNDITKTPDYAQGLQSLREQTKITPETGTSTTSKAGSTLLFLGIAAGALYLFNKK